MSTPKSFGLAQFAIKPGQETLFRERARACFDAAATDLTGTQAYEWFITPDGSSCTVIEIYDGVEAMAHHSRCVGHTVRSLVETCDTTVTLSGDVPAPVVERMQKIFGGASYGGPRLVGRLHDPAPGKITTDEGGRIYAVARFSVLPGHEQEFRALAQECLAAVVDREPGTLVYEWFFDAQSSECITLDVYRDVAALQAHRANVGALMAKVLKIVKSSVEMYGAVPPEMAAKFDSALGLRFVAPRFQGIL